MFDSHGVVGAGDLRAWLAELTPDARDSYIAHMSGVIATATRNLAAACAVADDCGDPEDDGVRDSADRLVAQGWARVTANAVVRAGHVLADLPNVEAAFGDGEFTFDQIRLLVGFVTAEADKEASVEFPAWSVRQLEREAARHKPAPTAEDEAAMHERRFVRFRCDRRSGEWRMSAVMDPSFGAGVQTCLCRIAEAYGPDPETQTWAPQQQRLADALCDLCGTDPAADTTAERACVSVFVGAEQLLGRYDADTGTCELDLPVSAPLAAETARRLACDSWMQPIYLDHDGHVIGIDHTTRTVPAKLYRLLHHRDGGECRFPGCGARRLFEAHHVTWVEDGGRTTLDNLLLVCKRHHHLLHEGGYRVEGHPEDGLVFRRPDGTPVRAKPPPLHPRIRTLFDPP